MAKKIDLYMPSWYMDVPEEERKKGRCGPGTGIWEKLVPETIWFMPYTDCCQIHDKEYDPMWNPEIVEALKITDSAQKNNALLAIKHRADDRFLDNLKKKVEEYSANGFMRWIRNYRVMTTYNAVAITGGSAFWHNIRDYENLDK